MRRREFIAGLAGAAAWSLPAPAQPNDRVRHIGILIASSEMDHRMGRGAPANAPKMTLRRRQRSPNDTENQCR
jgi:hypothetical protein